MSGDETAATNSNHSSMKLVKNPPKFSHDKSYNIYKAELEAWKSVVDIDEKKLGSIIALSLPENDPSDIRHRVFASIDVKADDGFTKLIEFLDQEYEKDKTQDMCEKIRAFMHYKRKEDMSMQNYIAGFDAAYRIAKNKGLPEMPEPYLMFQIMENSLLSDNEYRMVLTSVDMTKEKEMYKSTKAVSSSSLVFPNLSKKKLLHMLLSKSRKKTLSIKEEVEINHGTIKLQETSKPDLQTLASSTTISNLGETTIHQALEGDHFPNQSTHKEKMESHFCVTLVDPTDT